MGTVNGENDMTTTHTSRPRCVAYDTIEGKHLRCSNIAGPNGRCPHHTYGPDIAGTDAERNMSREWK